MIKITVVKKKEGEVSDGGSASGRKNRFVAVFLGFPYEKFLKVAMVLVLLATSIPKGETNVWRDWEEVDGDREYCGKVLLFLWMKLVVLRLCSSGFVSGIYRLGKKFE